MVLVAASCPWPSRNEEDLKFYKGKVTESVKRLGKIQAYLDNKEWEEVRAELSRQVRKPTTGTGRALALPVRETTSWTRADVSCWVPLFCRCTTSAARP